MENSQINDIDIIELLKIFRKRIVVIILSAAIAVTAVLTYSLIVYKPEYSSKATMYILKQNDNSQSVSASDFTLALNVVNDCTYILKMQSVLEEAIDELKLDVSYKELKGNITTNNPNGTRILEVTAVADTPELAKSIVDSVCLKGADKIADSMGFTQVNVSEFGNINTEPCNKVGIKVYAIAAAVAVVLTYAVFVVIYIFDDSINSNEDVQRYLGLSVLGMIPDYNCSSKKKYKYNKYESQVEYRRIQENDIKDR